jgi:hypothetical protein
MAAIARILQRFGVPAEAHTDVCRAAERRPACQMSVVVRQAPAAEPAAAS